MIWPDDYINKIICGDCLEVMKGIPDGAVDLVVTDPPYNFTTASAGSGKLNPWADLCNSSLWFSTWMKECLRSLRYVGAMWQFCNWRSLPTITKATFDIGTQIESLLVWDKDWIGPGGPNGLRPSYELVSLIRNGGFGLPNRGIPDIKKSQWSSRKPTGHPAEKPIDLISWLIDISFWPNLTSSPIILDPFAGSGTTGVAAKQLGRKYILIEINPDYCKMAEDRLRQEELF